MNLHFAGKLRSRGIERYTCRLHPIDSLGLINLIKSFELTFSVEHGRYAEPFFSTAALTQTRARIVGQTVAHPVLQSIRVAQRPRRPRVPAFGCC